MKILRRAVVTLLLCSTSAFAAPASEGSIKQLLEVMQSQKLIDAMQAQIEALMNNSIQQALKGKVPTVKQQQAINNMKSRMVAIMQGELSWDKLEPIYLRLYKESFTEEEINGMVTFYKTPAGQAVIHKMPGLMQKTMFEVQQITTGMTPKMQKVQEQFVAEMAAANK